MQIQFLRFPSQLIVHKNGLTIYLDDLQKLSLMHVKVDIGIDLSQMIVKFIVLWIKCAICMYTHAYLSESSDEVVSNS